MYLGQILNCAYNKCNGFISALIIFIRTECFMVVVGPFAGDMHTPDCMLICPFQIQPSPNANQMIKSDMSVF